MTAKKYVRAKPGDNKVILVQASIIQGVGGTREVIGLARNHELTSP